MRKFRISPPDFYDIMVKAEHTLANIVSNVYVSSTVTNVNLCVLREGDANEDGVVDIDDFSLLADHFMTSCGDSGYDAASDFNRSCVVDIDDFTMLVDHFMEQSPIDCP